MPRKKRDQSIDADLTRRLSRDDPSILSFVYLTFASNTMMKLADEQLRKSGLSVARYTILRILEDGQPQTLGYLSDKHFCEAGNMTRLIARMEQDGHLTRAPDSVDGRVTRVRITQEGKALCDQVGAEHRRFIQTLMSGISGEELGTLAGYLQRLATHAVDKKATGLKPGN